MGDVTGQPGGSGAGRTAASGTDPQHLEKLLVRAFVQLADSLVEEFDVVEFLQSLSAHSVEVLGAGAAGVMLADPRGELRLRASSEERMRVLEISELQGTQAHAWMLSARASQFRQASRRAAAGGRRSRDPARIRVCARCRCRSADASSAIHHHPQRPK